MSQYFNNSDSTRDCLSHIADKHCPDSVREDAYRELSDRGISHGQAQQMADEHFGDFWG